MGLFNKLLDIFVPPVCEVCGKEADHGKLLCGACSADFVRECFEHCPLCGKTASRCLCYTGFTDVTKTTLAGHRFFSLTFYKSEKNYGKTDRLTERLMLGLKENGRFSDVFAEEMCRGLSTIFDKSGENIDDWIITYPPRSVENLYKNGFDQCEAVCAKMGEIIGCEVRPTLRRGGHASEQKTLDAFGRRENAENTLIPIRKNISEGERFILFDDIITTGATVSAAAEKLYSCGAAAVFPVSIARTMMREIKSVRD